MDNDTRDKVIQLDTSRPIWDHFFTVAPLIVIGSKENDGYDLAPKHMATPLGKENYFGFVCTPRHSTYHNIKKHKNFTVSFPTPDQITMASLAASPRCGEGGQEKPIVHDLPSFPAVNIDALFIRDAYLYFECELYKIVDGFGAFSLITGRITSAFVNKEAIKTSEADEQALIYQTPLLAYLANGRFAKIKESFAFPFPKGFSV